MRPVAGSFGTFEVRFRGADTPTKPLLLDVLGFLFDVNLLYEIARIGVDPRYGDVRLGGWWFTRRGRPLSEDDRLRLVSLRHESPVEVVTILTATIGAAGALWALVQTAEKISNWRLNREKLRAELEKVKLEVEKLQLEVREKKELLTRQERALLTPEGAEAALINNEPAALAQAKVVRRLQAAPINLADLDIALRAGKPGKVPK